MDLVVRGRWTAALRSGDYHRGSGTLALVVPEEPVRYCCLGVLCELAALDGVVERYDVPLYATAEWTSPATYATDDAVPLPYRRRYGVDPVDRSDTHLPWSVVRWAGLDHTNPSVRVPDADRQQLSVVNDVLCVPFATIANLIEESDL